MSETIGIIGAGKLGMTLAQLARKANYKVKIAGSANPSKIALSVEVLAPGAYAVSSEEAADTDIVILALPLGRVHALPADILADKLVIDATNYWWEVDGQRSDIVPEEQSSSEAIQEFLPRSRVVKAFNHMGYHDLHDEAKPTDSVNRKAIAVAGDNREDVALVSRLIDDFGFDSLPMKSLSVGRSLEPGHPAFGANLSGDELAKVLKSA